MVVLSILLILNNFLFIPVIFQEKKKTSFGVHSLTSDGSLKISKLELWKPIPGRRKGITSE